MSRVNNPRGPTELTVMCGWNSTRACPQNWTLKTHRWLTKRNKRRKLETASRAQILLNNYASYRFTDACSHTAVRCHGGCKKQCICSMPWWLQKAVQMRQWNLVTLCSPHETHQNTNWMNQKIQPNPTHTQQDQLWWIDMNCSSLSLSLYHPGDLHKTSVYSAKAKLSRVRKSAWSKRNPRVQWFNPDHGLSLQFK